MIKTNLKYSVSSLYSSLRYFKNFMPEKKKSTSSKKVKKKRRKTDPLDAQNQPQQAAQKQKNRQKRKQNDNIAKKGNDRRPKVKHKFLLRGKQPPKQSKSIKVTPSVLRPEQMTTIYTVPSEHFVTKEDVAAYNGYELLEPIGRGGFAIVYRAISTRTGQQCACKVVEIDDRRSRIDEMKNELYIMELVNCTYAIKLYLHYLVNTSLFIFMQLADAGSFSKYLDNEGALPEHVCVYFFTQMCCGIDCMHQLSITHRDIKPANFLMATQDGRYIIMVSDYGLSRVVRLNSNGEPCMYTSQCGTPAFMAPEILAGLEYNPFQVDVWSLGVTLYSMLCDDLPFDVDQDDYGVSQMRANDWKFGSYIKETPSEALNKLLSGMLEGDWKKRLTLKQVCQHEWLKADYDKLTRLKRPKR